MKNKLLILLLFNFLFSNTQAQILYKSWNPAVDTTKVLEGQAWPAEMKDYYSRLPARAEQEVRPVVWNLSENSAGLQLRFHTNATDIIIKYAVSGGLQMHHMPATGVSGVDLYTKTIDGKWLYCAGSFQFADTITYHFKNLPANDQHVASREYTLYLPLYNTVKWLQVDVPHDSYFRALPKRVDKPIVTYGTSIMQGGCASRPGLAWPAILGRHLDRPVINLGFSGNGRLEKEVVSLLAEIDAKIFVLDCLPNLTGTPFHELKSKINQSIADLRKEAPNIPILLTDHAGFTDEETVSWKREQVKEANLALHTVFDSLKNKGVKNLFLLTKDEIGLDIESAVDGIHPNDIGMMLYAQAYERKLREILNEPKGNISTTMPLTQRRDASIYDWETRHQQILAFNKVNQPDVVLIGNSITHYWAGQPLAPQIRGEASWLASFGKNSLNMGFGWDRVENVLWRIYHGELDGIRPRKIILMIGTNNLQINTDEEIVTGLKNLLKAIQVRQPGASIGLLGILPRKGMEQRVAKLNRKVQAAFAASNIKYADAGIVFLNKDQQIDEALFSDGLHPNTLGYEKLGLFIQKQLIGTLK